MKDRYDIVAKFEPLCWVYGDSIKSIKLKVNGFLVNFIDCFQALEMLQQEIYSNAEHEYQIVMQIIEHIEDQIFSSPCKTIKNWLQGQKRFCGAAETLRVHEVRSMTDQSKRVIEDWRKHPPSRQGFIQEVSIWWSEVAVCAEAGWKRSGKSVQGSSFTQGLDYYDKRFPRLSALGWYRQYWAC